MGEVGPAEKRAVENRVAQVRVGEVDVLQARPARVAAKQGGVGEVPPPDLDAGDIRVLEVRAGAFAAVKAGGKEACLIEAAVDKRACDVLRPAEPRQREPAAGENAVPGKKVGERRPGKRASGEAGAVEFLAREVNSREILILVLFSAFYLHS